MDNVEKEIYAKEQQVHLINVILSSLCYVELSADGRKLLNRIVRRLTTEIENLKGLRIEANSV